MIVTAGAPGVVRGQEPASPPNVAPAWAYDSAEPVEPGDIAARALDERVSAEVATHRFRVERATSVLQREAERRWPATFAGVWIDTTAFTVQVAFTADAVTNVAALAASFPFPSELRPVPALRSKAQLLALQERLDADRSLLTGTYGRFDLDVDLPANQAVIRLARVTDDVRRRLLTTYGPALRADVGLAAPASCDPSACRPTLYGGIDIVHGPKGCTGAFTAAIGTYRYILSAGHCYTDSGVADVTHDGVYYGSRTAHQYSGRVDAERVRNFSPGVFRESSKFFIYGETPRDVKAYKLHADIAVGAYVGKTGATTWTTRGYVKSTVYKPSYVVNGSSFITADMCADHGDSGGPLWSGTTAFGILSGGVPGECRITNGRPNTKSWGLFGSIEYAIGALGVTLLSGVNALPVAEFHTQCDVLMSCQFNGLYSRDDDGVLTYAWDFGDGSTSTDAAPMKKYAVPDTYTVKLTVRDNDGAIATVSRTVQPPIGGTG